MHPYSSRSTRISNDIKSVVKGVMIWEISMWQTKQSTHCVMALLNVIWPWSIFYSKGQLLSKENKESLGVYYFLKLKINLVFGRHVPNLPRNYKYMECLESKILKTKMFEFQCVDNESWNLYVKYLESKILKTKMSELKCVNT
jgi:hypothetical protein